MYRPSSRTIAAATAMLGIVSLLTAALYFSTLPDNPSGDGFAAGLTGLFVILCVIMGPLTLGEAGLLFFVTHLREPTKRSRQLLTTGAIAGSLSVVLLVVPLLVARVVDGLSPAFLTLEPGIGLVLVPIGIICSGVGTIVQIVDELSTETRT